MHKLGFIDGVGYYHNICKEIKLKKPSSIKLTMVRTKYNSENLIDIYLSEKQKYIIKYEADDNKYPTSILTISANDEEIFRIRTGHGETFNVETLDIKNDDDVIKNNCTYVDH